jgi:hypothetical protein
LNRKSEIKETWWKVALDLSIGFSIITVYIFASHQPVIVIRNIMLGTFFSMFPDLLTLLYWEFNFKFLEKIYRFHQFTHHRFMKGSPERKWNFRNAYNDILFSVLAIISLLL